MLNKFILILFSFACSIFQVNAQITLDDDSLKANGFSGVDANDYIDLSAHTMIRNTRNSPDTIIWVRTVNVLQSGVWTSAVCDINQCWQATVNTAEFILKAKDSGNLSFHFYPVNVCGNGKMTVQFYRKSNPLTITSIEIKSRAWCLNSNVSILSKTNLIIFPNPASSTFALSSESINSGILSLYTLEGKLVSQTNYLSGSLINSSNLASGVYLVLYSNGIETIKHKLIIE